MNWGQIHTKQWPSAKVTTVLKTTRLTWLTHPPNFTLAVVGWWDINPKIHKKKIVSVLSK